MPQAVVKTIPTELEAMDRDLSFRPSTVTAPRTLTAEQVAGYNRDGYIAGIPVFDRHEIASHRRSFNAPEASDFGRENSAFVGRIRSGCETMEP